MHFKTYTWNGNEVECFGRLVYWVGSNSREGLRHFVDLEKCDDWREPCQCTCEAFKYGERPCRHVTACLQAIAHWANVREEIREEWTDRLQFLLSMGHSFQQALESPSLMELRKPPQPQRQIRQYVLPANV